MIGLVGSVSFVIIESMRSLAMVETSVSLGEDILSD